MEWYHYMGVFFAAAFLCNAVPHFVNGVSGNKFPTPFAKPPGKGLSSPLVNVLWSVFNMAVGYIMLRASHMTCDNIPALVTFFAGLIFMGIISAIIFQKKDKE